MRLGRQERNEHVVHTQAKALAAVHIFSNDTSAQTIAANIVKFAALSLAQVCLSSTQL